MKARVSKRFTVACLTYARDVGGRRDGRVERLLPGEGAEARGWGRCPGGAWPDSACGEAAERELSKGGGGSQES